MASFLSLPLSFPFLLPLCSLSPLFSISISLLPLYIPLPFLLFLLFSPLFPLLSSSLLSFPSSSPLFSLLRLPPLLPLQCCANGSIPECAEIKCGRDQLCCRSSPARVSRRLLIPSSRSLDLSSLSSRRYSLTFVTRGIALTLNGLNHKLPVSRWSLPQSHTQN